VQQHSIAHSAHAMGTSNTSREASPLSNMITSQESSPSVFFNNSPSPTMGVEFVNGTMLNGRPQSSQWPINYDFNLQAGHTNSGLMPATLGNNISTALSSSSNMPFNQPFRPILTIHPTPLKSRVETQIPIKLTLFPMPLGVTKLHLPTHTISKPKLLAKPPPPKSPDTLELTTTLVCTSAMQNPEYRRRAFARAAMAVKESSDRKPEEGGQANIDEDEENKPLNGGEVKICVGCITRERKRAARKKVKRVEEEESWHKDEHKRVIVFNTQEVKDWQPPSNHITSDIMGDRQDPIVPDGAMQVDAPMRIACYCRHQNEKLGFQVIFTIKDWKDRLVAQEITSSIMITDDHKTHNIPQQLGTGSEVPIFHTNNGLFGHDSAFGVPMDAFRASHSSSDLQNLQQNYPLAYQAPPINTPLSLQTSHNAAPTMTPRTFSRQASPSGSLGPTNKKRKASGSSKVPSGLAMTRLETTQQPAGSSTGSSSAIPTPSTYQPSLGPFASTHDNAFNQFSVSIPPAPPQYNTGPPTPNSNDQVFFSSANRSQSMDNIAMHQLYSAPASSHPSRAPSPNGLRNNVQAYQHQQAQIVQAVANGLYGMPLSLNPHRPPTIHKMIPNEGPKAGGIEVTCLGSGFCQGLEVMFGDVKATTTTYWGETSLVCLLPPATSAGTVAVTFKHQHQQQLQPFATGPIPKQQAYFKYVDDDEQQIIRTALSVLGHKMTGKMEDVRELARRIVGDGPSSWGAPGGHPSSTGSTQHQVSGFNAATFGIDVEATLLKILDLIDLDDSSHLPRLNMRRSSGQTMLHLACSLGLHRFVAALLARGANPEPRDKGGFTPMHFAAMHGHPQIVRRLVLSGADPTWRTLQGYTPSDLSATEEVLRSTRRIEFHSRRRSGGSIRSRTSSATSLRSLWEPPSTTQPSPNPEIIDEDSSDYSNDEEKEDEDEDTDPAGEGVFWMRPRRRSTHVPIIDVAAQERASSLSLPVPDGPIGAIPSPAAAMTAFRDHFTAQIQHLQQSMQHLNLPNLPQMPNLPDYQAYLPTAPMVRRISSLVPHMGASRNNGIVPNPKETDYKWWDLFSNSLSTAPPAYEDIFPHGDGDVKTRAIDSNETTATGNDKSVTDITSVAESSQLRLNSTSPSALLENLRIGTKHTMTQEQQMQLRRAHAEKVKRFRSDRNLFFIWVSAKPIFHKLYHRGPVSNIAQIPLLIVIIFAMLYNRAPQFWADGSQLINSFARWRAGGTINA
jgi:hypothetical protein